MEGVKVSDVGHGGPVGTGGQGGAGSPWGDMDGDGGLMGCWMWGWGSQTYRVLGRGWGSHEVLGWESVEWLDGGRVPVAGLEVPVPWGAREGGVHAPAPHVTLWARR